MRNKSNYLIQMTVGFVAYALGLVAMNHFYQQSLPYKYLLILLPVLPLVYVASVIMRAVTEMDEMWRKILSEALGFSAIATAFTCFSYLFIRDMGGPEFHAEWAFYMMWAYYGIGFLVSGRRYR